MPERATPCLLIALLGCSLAGGGGRSPPPGPRATLVFPAHRDDDPCATREAYLRAGRGEPYIGCGPLARFQIREVLERSRAAFEACRPAPREQDERFVVTWTIAPSGDVQGPRVDALPAGAEDAGDCLARTVAGLTFPRPLGGATAIVTFPFVFRPEPTPPR